MLGEGNDTGGGRAAERVGGEGRWEWTQKKKTRHICNTSGEPKTIGWRGEEDLVSGAYIDVFLWDERR